MNEIDDVVTVCVESNSSLPILSADEVVGTDVDDCSKGHELKYTTELKGRLLIIEKERDDLRDKIIALKQHNVNLQTQLETANQLLLEEQDKVEKMFEVFERQVEEEENVKRELGQHFRNLSSALEDATSRLNERNETIRGLEATIRALRLENERNSDMYKEDIMLYESLRARNKSTEERLSKLETKLANDIMNSRISDTGVLGEPRGTDEQELFDVITHYKESSLVLEQRILEFDDRNTAMVAQIADLQLQLTTAREARPGTLVGVSGQALTTEENEELTAWKVRCQKLEKNLTVVKSSRDAVLQDLRAAMEGSHTQTTVTPSKELTVQGTAFSDSRSSPFERSWSSTARMGSPVDVLKNAFRGCIVDLHDDADGDAVVERRPISPVNVKGLTAQQDDLSPGIFPSE